METGESPEVFVPQQPDVLAVTDVGNSSGIIAGKNALYVLLRRIGDMQILKVVANCTKTNSFRKIL